MGESNLGDSSVRVLVIEDNADDRELLLRQLHKSGMDGHVKFISDGQEALDFLTGPTAPIGTENLIAILLDLRLPSLSGLELLRQLRSRDGFPCCPGHCYDLVQRSERSGGMPQAQRGQLRLQSP